MSTTKLCAKTLRAVSVRLRKRASLLRKREVAGLAPEVLRTGRMLEADLQADNLLQEARELEAGAKRGG